MNTTLARHKSGIRGINYYRSFDLLDLDEVELIRTFSGHTDEVTSVAFSPDGKYAISGSKDASIRFWDIDTGELLATDYNSAIKILECPELTASETAELIRKIQTELVKLPK